MKMTDRELVAIIDDAESNDIANSGSYNSNNEEYLKYYQAEPFGDEVDGRSSVISTEVRDLIESDMPSLARVFLGAGAPVEFRAANVGDPDAVQEAKDKQAVVYHIIKNIPNSFRIQHDWLKSSELQSMAMLEYGVDEVKTPKVKRYKCLSADELTELMTDLEGEEGVDSVKIVEEEYSDKAENKYFIRNVPSEDIIVSRNAWNKNEADIVGKRFTKTRSTMIAEGFERSVVEGLPASTSSSANNEGTKEQRYKDQGGKVESATIKNKANDLIRGLDVYVNVDFDDDGIAERRHIIKVENEILLNEYADHVPFSIISSMLMPNNINGLPRAELAMTYQKVGSVLWRQTLDNLYAVNNPRTAYTSAVNVDDLLDISLNGIIEVDGDVPGNHLFQLTTPYVGDKALQVVAYMDGKRASSTGSIQANQALQGDQLNEETATRFKGMEQAATAKIELVARVIAETGYRDLYEGIGYYAAHYQDEELEVHVLGRNMLVNPQDWKFDHHINALVGTGAGDDEKTLANLSAIFQVQSSLKAEGSMLADDQKRYNTLTAMTRATGRDSVQDYFNNPEMPAEMVEAERDMLRQQVEQMDQASQNPLAEAEAVKAKGMLEATQMKQKYDAQIDQMRLEANYQDKLRDAQMKFRESTDSLTYDYNKLKTDTDLKYTELELKYKLDIPGQGMDMGDKSNQELITIINGGK
jgi:hypothetical protein